MRWGLRGLLRLSLVVYLSIRIEDANATRILWKHATIATAKIGIVTLEISEAAAGPRGSPSPSPISANLSQLTSARGSPSLLFISAFFLQIMTAHGSLSPISINTNIRQLPAALPLSLFPPFCVS